MEIYLILASVVILALMVVFMTIRNKRKERRDFIIGVKRGLEDYRAGKVKPWDTVKKSLAEFNG